MKAWLIFAGLALPLGFIAVVAAVTWATIDPPPWHDLLVLGAFALAAAVAAGAWAVRDFVLPGVPILSLLAAGGLAVAVLTWGDQHTLYERGHDVACRITSITKHEHVDPDNGITDTSYEYGVDCDGGVPTTINDSVVPVAQARVGLRVAVRYDPGGVATTVATGDDQPDGHVALIWAVIAAGVLVLIGVGSAVIVAVIE